MKNITEGGEERRKCEKQGSAEPNSILWAGQDSWLHSRPHSSSGCLYKSCTGLRQSIRQHRVRKGNPTPNWDGIDNWWLLWKGDLCQFSFKSSLLICHPCSSVWPTSRSILTSVFGANGLLNLRQKRTSSCGGRKMGWNWKKLRIVGCEYNQNIIYRFLEEPLKCKNLTT